jgi:hypothetical protein
MKASNAFRVGVQALVGTGLILVLALATTPVLAQSGSTTGITGHVTDATGGAMPGASVTVTNVDTGDTRTATTDQEGLWEIRFLAPGPNYLIVFEMDGFKTLRRSGVGVTTWEMVLVDVVLEVGQITDTVEVVADAAMVASSPTVVRTLDQKELESLPTSARNFTQLLVIEPGVSADISDLLSNNNASISPSVNGARTTDNSFVFNGIDVTSMLCCNSRVNVGGRGTIEEGGGTLSRNIAPAPETLQEVKLQTNLYDAGTGRNGGGNFTLVSKTGTNRFEGQAWYYHQNDAFIANDWFFNRAGIDRQELRRHEGGVTVGGPIIKDRTHFFASYQRTDARTAYVDEASNTIRMPQALTDDRSDAAIDRFAETVWTDDHGPFNPAAINPISRALLKAAYADGTLLIPSGDKGINCAVQEDQIAESCQVTSVIPATYEQDQFTFNLDHRLTDSNRMSAKLFYADQPSRDPLSDNDALTLQEAVEDTGQTAFSFTDIHIFGPTVVNEFRAGVFKNRNNTVPVMYFTNAEFGIENPYADVVPDLSQITIDGDDVGQEIQFGTEADGVRIFDKQTTFTIGNTISFTMGNHSLRVGGEYRRHHLDGDLQEGRNRRHNFDEWFDYLTVGYADPDDKGRARQISDSSLNFGQTQRQYRLTDWNWFIADDWKVTPRLTVNIGVRHEYFGFPSEVNGLVNLFDYDNALATGSVQQGFIFPSNFSRSFVPGSEGQDLRLANSTVLVPGDYNNFMPRVGFAYSLSESGTVVLRGGYGIFFQRITGSFANSQRQSSPLFIEGQRDDLGDWNDLPNEFPPFPILDFVVGFDDGEPQVETAQNPGVEFETYESQMISPDLSTPYMQQWNVNVQWEFMPDWLLEVGYIGSKGTKLMQQRNINQALDVNALGFLERPGVPGGGFLWNYYTVGDDDEWINTPEPTCDIFDDPDDCTMSAEVRAPLLGFDEDEGVNTITSDANSIYHSLQLVLRKRFSRGLLFNVNYTFSRSIDLFSDEGIFQVQNDQLSPWLNRGLSDFHRKHRLIFSWVWDLPFHGSRFAEGWQISGVGTFQSGRPLSVIDDDYSGILFDPADPRPNLAPGATHADQTTSGSVSSRVDNYLNRDAFEQAGLYFGTLGRNTVIGPNQRRLDVSLSKLTRLNDRMSLELRIEGYNVTNTPSFRQPGSDMSEGDFGEITEMRGGPRVFQVGAKFRF